MIQLVPGPGPLNVTVYAYMDLGRGVTVRTKGQTVKAKDEDAISIAFAEESFLLAEVMYEFRTSPIESSD